MRSTGFCKLLACLFLLACGSAQAVGTFVPAPYRTDMAYDDQRGLVYIASGGEILRYRVATGTFLPPVVLGGSLRGVDISPDGGTLAVADGTVDGDTLRVHVVDLQTLAIGRLEAPLAWYELGTWAVSYAHDGSLYASSSFAGSGSTPLRRFSADDGSVQVVAESVGQNTMLAASGDRTMIAFAESNGSNGSWGRIDAVTGQVVRSAWEQGTSWFNFEIATNATGSQYAIPTYGGTFIYDASFARVATFGVYAGPQPTGVAYHPVDSLAYFPWAGTSEVRVYDMEFLEPVGAYDLEQQFNHTGNWAYGVGRTRLSGDGSLLMVSVEGGVRILRMYTPLHADPVSARVQARKSRLKSFVPLRGSIGNGGDIAYEIVSQPAHGKAAVAGGSATYVPEPGFTGSDSFVYRARYGRAWADATVTISVE